MHAIHHGVYRELSVRKVRRKVEEELSLDEGTLDEYKEFMRILIDQARASKRPLALAHCHLRSLLLGRCFRRLLAAKTKIWRQAQVLISLRATCLLLRRPPQGCPAAQIRRSPRARSGCSARYLRARGCPR